MARETRGEELANPDRAVVVGCDADADELEGRMKQVLAVGGASPERAVCAGEIGCVRHVFPG